MKFNNMLSALIPFEVFAERVEGPLLLNLVQDFDGGSRAGG